MAILAMLVATLVVVGCGGIEPQQRTIDLNVTNGEFNLDPPVVKVNQDDDVTLRFVGDEVGDIHLHGYDLGVTVEPGKTVELVFQATATGKFDFELHLPGHSTEIDHNSEGHSHSHAEKTTIFLGSLEVYPR